MLTFPQVFTFEGIEVFPDDEDPNLFYLLSGRPRLRLQADGSPVFRGLFWTDDGTGTQTGGSVAGLRGALLHFDVNLEVSASTQQRILDQIRQSGVQQQRIDEMERDERERIARMARATGADASTLPRPRVPGVATPRFGAVQFLDGQVSLLEEKDGAFVAWTSTSGPPSLIGDNNSAFAMRLGPEGAAVWYRALEQDASAIGIRYELKFQARLPSLQIHVWAGSHQALELERKAKHVIENMDQGCSDADVERIDVTEVSEKLTEEGMINVEIIKGTAKISDEQVSQLRNTAIGLISDRVKEILLHKIRGMTEEERRTSLLQKVVEEANSFAELRLTQKDVIEWKANPQATITDFLGGLTGDARKRLVTLVDMSQPVVSTVEADVSVDAPWDADPAVSRVIVRVEYPAARNDPAGVQEFAFTKDTAPQKFACRRVARDRGTLNYTAQAFIKGAQDPIALPRGQTNGQIHVQVPSLGALKMLLRPHPTMFSTSGSGKLSAVQVDYSYKEDGAPDRVSESVVIRPADLDQGVAILHRTFRAIDAPVRFRPVYQRDGAAAITGREQQAWVQAGQESKIEIPLPWTDFLQVGARSLGPEGLRRIKVDLHYDDGEFQSEGVIVLDADSADAPGNAWSGKTAMPQLDKTRQRFRWRYSVEGPDQLVVGPWVDADGDQELVLPVMAVRLRTDRLALGNTFTEALVRLAYADPARHFETAHEFFLTREASSGTWLVPRVDPAVDGFKWTMTLFNAQGDQFQSEGEGSGENVILRPPA